MKQTNTSYTDQNWSWPQSTWFQKRLSEIKAREDAARRKYAGVQQKPGVVEAKPSNDKGSEDL